MGNPYDIADDDPEYLALLKQYGVEPPQAQKPKGGFFGDVTRGTGQVIGSFGTTAKDLGAERVGGAMERYGTGLARRNPAEINTFADVVEKPFTTVREGAGEMLPQLPANIGAGLAGRYVGGVAGGALGSLFGGVGAAPGAVAGQWLGGLGGAYLANLAQEYGGIRQEQAEQGIDKPGRALAAAAPAAALDFAIGPEGKVIKNVAKKGLKAGLVDTAEGIAKEGFFKSVGKGALQEGPLTEGPQTAMERWGAEKPLNTGEAWDEYAVASAKAAAGGGAMTGVMHPFGSRPQGEKPLTEDRPTNLLAPNMPEGPAGTQGTLFDAEAYRDQTPDTRPALEEDWQTPPGVRSYEDVMREPTPYTEEAPAPDIPAADPHASYQAQLHELMTDRNELDAYISHFESVGQGATNGLFNDQADLERMDHAKALKAQVEARMEALATQFYGDEYVAEKVDGKQPRAKKSAAKEGATRAEARSAKAEDAVSVSKTIDAIRYVDPRRIAEFKEFEAKIVSRIAPEQRQAARDEFVRRISDAPATQQGSLDFNAPKRTNFEDVGFGQDGYGMGNVESQGERLGAGWQHDLLAQPTAAEANAARSAEQRAATLSHIDQITADRERAVRKQTPYSPPVSELVERGLAGTGAGATTPRNAVSEGQLDLSGVRQTAAEKDAAAKLAEWERIHDKKNVYRQKLTNAEKAVLAQPKPVVSPVAVFPQREDVAVARVPQNAATSGTALDLSAARGFAPAGTPNPDARVENPFAESFALRRIAIKNRLGAELTDDEQAMLNQREVELEQAPARRTRELGPQQLDMFGAPLERSEARTAEEAGTTSEAETETSMQQRVGETAGVRDFTGQREMFDAEGNTTYDAGGDPWEGVDRTTAALQRVRANPTRENLDVALRTAFAEGLIERRAVVSDAEHEKTVRDALQQGLIPKNKILAVQTEADKQESIRAAAQATLDDLMAKKKPTAADKGAMAKARDTISAVDTYFANVSAMHDAIVAPAKQFSELRAMAARKNVSAKTVLTELEKTLARNQRRVLPKNFAYQYDALEINEQRRDEIERQNLAQLDKLIKANGGVITVTEADLLAIGVMKQNVKYGVATHEITLTDEPVPQFRLIAGQAVPIMEVVQAKKGDEDYNPAQPFVARQVEAPADTRAKTLNRDVLQITGVKTPKPRRDRGKRIAPSEKTEALAALSEIINLPGAGGNLIKMATMVSRGITYDIIAEKLGVDKSVISDRLQGVGLSAEQLHDLQREVGISADTVSFAELFGDNGEEQNYYQVSDSIAGNSGAENLSDIAAKWIKSAEAAAAKHAEREGEDANTLLSPIQAATLRAEIENAAREARRIEAEGKEQAEFDEEVAAQDDLSDANQEHDERLEDTRKEYVNQLAAVKQQRKDLMSEWGVLQAERAAQGKAITKALTGTKTVAEQKKAVKNLPQPPSPEKQGELEYEYKQDLKALNSQIAERSMYLEELNEMRVDHEVYKAVARKTLNEVGGEKRYMAWVEWEKKVAASNRAINRRATMGQVNSRYDMMREGDARMNAYQALVDAGITGAELANTTKDAMVYWGALEDSSVAWEDLNDDNRAAALLATVTYNRTISELRNSQRNALFPVEMFKTQSGVALDKLENSLKRIENAVKSGARVSVAAAKAAGDFSSEASGNYGPDGEIRSDHELGVGTGLGGLKQRTRAQQERVTSFRDLKKLFTKEAVAELNSYGFDEDTLALIARAAPKEDTLAWLKATLATFRKNYQSAMSEADNVSAAVKQVEAQTGKKDNRSKIVHAEEKPLPPKAQKAVEVSKATPVEKPAEVAPVAKHHKEPREDIEAKLKPISDEIARIGKAVATQKMRRTPEQRRRLAVLNAESKKLTDKLNRTEAPVRTAQTPEERNQKRKDARAEKKAADMAEMTREIGERLDAKFNALPYVSKALAEGTTIERGTPVYYGNANRITGTRASGTFLRTDGKNVVFTSDDTGTSVTMPANAVRYDANNEFSQSEQNGAGQDAKTMGNTLRKPFFSPARFNKLVTIFQSKNQLTPAQYADLLTGAADPDKVMAVHRNGHIYMFADNIAPGNELAVFLHEIGVHLGMVNLLGKAKYDQLTAQIEQWAKGSGKLENTLAKLALARAKSVGEGQKKSEFVAYFVEEAILHGADPTAVAMMREGPLKSWLRTVAAAMKAALRRLGFRNTDTLTTQNIVDMAYGAAALELTDSTAHLSKNGSRDFSTASAVVQSITDLFPNSRLNSSAWTNLKDMAHKFTPMWFTNTQLVERFGKKLTKLGEYVRLQQMADSTRQQIQADTQKVMVKWNALDADSTKTLNKLMLDATTLQAHPDKAFTDPANAHLKPEDKAAHADLAAEWNALPQAAKDTYHEARKVLDARWKERNGAYHGTVDNMYNPLIAKESDPKVKARLIRKRDKAHDKYNKLMESFKGPYFPMMRIGNYVVVGMSPKYAALKNSQENATGDNLEAIQNQIDELTSDPRHYSVSSYETAGEAEHAEKTLKTAEGFETRRLKREDFYASLSPMTTHGFADLGSAIDESGFDAKTASKIKAMMTDLFISALPENSALSREAKRRNVHGVKAHEMQRTFAISGERDAFYISRLKHSTEMNDALVELQKQAKDEDNKSSAGFKYEHLHEEMKARMALDMTFNDNPVQNALSTLSWAYHLGVSPAFVFINSTQPWLVTGPVLSGRFGLKPATDALTKAAADSFKVLKAARTDKSKPFGERMTQALDLSGLKPLERAMTENLIRRRILDIGMEHDLSTEAQGTTPALAKVQKVMGWATQQVELTNRLTTSLASYRLAIDEGMTHDKAVDYAYDTTSQTQFDYNAGNTARVMREGGPVPMAKLIFQFRRYQQSMLYLLGKNFDAAFRGTGADKEHARATLKYLFASQGLVAGTLGMPMAGVALALAGLGGDDDDEEGSPEVRWRNMLTKMVGKDAAMVLTDGVPTMFGVNLSKRIGTGDVASPFPMAKFSGAQGNSKNTVGQALVNAAGAPANMAVGLLDAKQFFESGQWGKGVEKLAQFAGKWPSDVLRAHRFSTAGMTDRHGRVIVPAEDFTGTDIMLRAAGFAPTRESTYYLANNAKMDVTTAIKERRTALIERLALQAERGESISSLIRGDAVTEFNAKHRRQGALGRVTAADVLKKVNEDKKIPRQRDASGVRFTKAERDFKGLTEFAR